MLRGRESRKELCSYVPEINRLPSHGFRCYPLYPANLKNESQIQIDDSLRVLSPEGSLSSFQVMRARSVEQRHTRFENSLQ